MKILSFRICNFRSIIDTGVIRFSNDNITALVGQNESGKSAILDALALTFTDIEPSSDDFRFGDEKPQIFIETQSPPGHLEKIAEIVQDERLRKNLIQKISLLNGRLNWVFYTYLSEGNPPKINHFFENLILTADDVIYKDEENKESIQSNSVKNQKEELWKFADAVFDDSPTFIPFREQSGLLPNSIDVPLNATLKGIGSSAAMNFLQIAGINLKTLLDSDTKSQTAILKKANKKITEEFRTFWKQNIGEISSIELSCSIHQYPAGREKQGQSFLEFLISDGENTLHPTQRSRGTRWFISFFLQLRASAETGSKNYYLLDEPGSNLHEKAQNDVLNLIEKISSKIGVIYSTHSPHLIKQDRLNRILAVERDGSTAGSPTRVITAHSLGAANIDTLSPIFVAMGVSLARQTAIRAKNNVILEELSAQYYLRAFWKLLECKQEAHFIAATGASNIPLLANLFLGWGLDFIVVMDDEPTGRGIYNQLKRDMFMDDSNWAKSRLCKVSDCHGIEDIFEPEDYFNIAKNFVHTKDQRNSIWAKRHGATKGIDALNFLQNVENHKITLSSLHEKTQERISGLVSSIVDRLANYQSAPKDYR